MVGPTAEPTRPSASRPRVKRSSARRTSGRTTLPGGPSSHTSVTERLGRISWILRVSCASLTWGSMYSRASVSSFMGATTPLRPKSATPPRTQNAREAGTITHRQRNVKAGRFAARAANHRPPRTFRCCPVGVLRILWSAGKSVNTTTHVIATPTATQIPISRIGRIRDTASAVNPTAVANSDAVHGRNLLASVRTWCSSNDSPSGCSTNREWMYTSVDVQVTRIVIGTSEETIVITSPDSPA